jgi:WD40 repeat protein
VSSSYDNTCRVWDLMSQKCIGTLSGHSGIVRCLQVRDNNHVYTGSDDFTIRNWDLSLIPPARSQSPSVMSSASSPSQSPKLDPQAHHDIVPSITECCIDTLEGHSGPVTAIYADDNHLVSDAFLIDGSMIFSIDACFVIGIWICRQNYEAMGSGDRPVCYDS